jgi:hypothetical protein
MFVDSFVCENAAADTSDVRSVVMAKVLSFISFASGCFSFLPGAVHLAGEKIATLPFERAPPL